LEISPHNLVKTIIYRAEDKFVALLIRGDREMNDAKVRRALNCPAAELASPEEIEKLTGAPVGFAGPVGLDGARIVADNTVTDMTNFVVGANKDDTHLMNVNIDRDFKVEEFLDFSIVQAGDICPTCDAVLDSYRGIEVGQIFKLGTRYSESMSATFSREEGPDAPFVMGCYGIGTTRAVASAIEQNNDENGIIWPLSIAPYHVIITTLGGKNEDVATTAENIYSALSDAGVEVLLDDRNERPGVKFKDADLIGIPYRITIGSKGLKEGIGEIRDRKTGTVEKVPLDSISNYLIKIVCPSS
ncbi:YbaK/EbsC family protein, partial [Candidatus Hydrogenedentota bacterium]